MRIALFGLALALSACATSYQPNTVASNFNLISGQGGFSETQLAPDTFRVTFKANTRTDMDRVLDFTLLRSAELTLQNGFRYFVIVEAADRSQTIVGVTPRQTVASATASGNSAYGTATTYGGHAYSVTKPSVSNTIVCLNEKPAGMSYDADFIAKSLRAKYGIATK